MSATNRVSALIATTGRSVVLGEVLVAVRDQDVIDEVVLVAQAWDPPVELVALCDRIITLDSNVGFAKANNRGLETIDAPLVALINDDAVPNGDWARCLVAELSRDSTVAAVQGVNLQASSPEIVDGCGIEWNWWLQAVQIGRGQPAAVELEESRAIFGVSATAAIYRRSVLEDVAESSASPFDEGLGSYYEDVDLACRLQTAGHRAMLVPAATVQHFGSMTGKRLPMAGRDLIYSNRHLVLAKTLGRRYWSVLPRALLRDVIDGMRAVSLGDWGTVRALSVAVVRVCRLMSEYGSFDRASLSLDRLRPGRRQ